MGEAVSRETSRYLRDIGRRGGKETLRRHGKKHFSKAGKKGMASRWGKQPHR